MKCPRHPGSALRPQDLMPEGERCGIATNMSSMSSAEVEELIVKAAEGAGRRRWLLTRGNAQSFLHGFKAQESESIDRRDANIRDGSSSPITRWILTTEATGEVFWSEHGTFLFTAMTDQAAASKMRNVIEEFDEFIDPAILVPPLRPNSQGSLNEHVRGGLSPVQVSRSSGLCRNCSRCPQCYL